MMFYYGCMVFLLRMYDVSITAVWCFYYGCMMFLLRLYGVFITAV